MAPPPPAKLTLKKICLNEIASQLFAYSQVIKNFELTRPLNLD